MRDVWLIAFMAYTFACLLVDIAYPVNIPLAKARELSWRSRGDPAEAARIRVEDMAASGLPLSSAPEGLGDEAGKEAHWSIPGSSIGAVGCTC